MDKKTLLAASLAGMFALTLATTGCSKEAAPVEAEVTAPAAVTEVQVEPATANAEADKTKESCNGKDGCSAKTDKTKESCKAATEKH